MVEWFAAWIGKLYDESKQSIDEVEFDQGMWVGEHRQIRNGHLLYTFPKSNGVSEGTVKEYNKEGSVIGEWTYDMNVAHGPYRTYYDQGQLSGKASFLTEHIMEQPKNIMKTDFRIGVYL